MLGFGRNIITTTYKEVTRDNVIEIIQAAMPYFRQNAQDCDFLMRYDAGEQPLKRTSDKKVMPWIDCQAVDNVAHEISDFWVGYMFGNPITVHIFIFPATYCFACFTNDGGIHTDAVLYSIPSSHIFLISSHFVVCVKIV